jgi:hypothetical protein
LLTAEALGRLHAAALVPLGMYPAFASGCNAVCPPFTVPHRVVGYVHHLSKAPASLGTYTAKACHPRSDVIVSRCRLLVSLTTQWW